MNYIIHNLLVVELWRLFAFSLLLIIITIIFKKNTRFLTAGLLALIFAYAVFYAVPYLKMFKKPTPNFTHYYLGAKYSIDYKDFYIVTKAALGGPMTGFTNLSGEYTKEENTHYFTEEAERKYCVSLLNAAKVPFKESEDFKSIRDKCSSNGLYKDDADKVLESKNIDKATAAAIKTDLVSSYFDFGDKGFNGSPFYVLLRNFDPALYYPLGIRAFWWWNVLEYLMLFGAAFFLSRTFAWGLEQIAIFACIVLFSVDFSTWAIQGAVSMSWFLPSIIAICMLKKENYVAAGGFTAAAVLLKIFPVIILAAFGVKTAMDFAKTRSIDGIKKQLQFFGYFAFFCAALALVSTATGMSWSSWAHKISIQMLSGGMVSNNISVFNAWSVISGETSRTAATFTVSLWALRLMFLGIIAAIILKREKIEAITYGAVAGLIFMPWISVDFFNYYTIAHAVAITVFFRTRPVFFYISIALFLMTNSTLLTLLSHYIAPMHALSITTYAYYPLIPVLFAMHLLLPEKKRGIGADNAAIEQHGGSAA